MAVNVEHLYNQYAPMVLRRCRAILKDEDAALDAMQETFLQVLRKRDQLHDTAPSSMLYTFATNISLNSLRKRRRLPDSYPDELLEQVAWDDKVEERTLNAHLLEQVFNTEQGSSRRIAELRYLEGRTLTETAAQVGLSVSGVRRRLRSLRQRGLALQGSGGGLSGVPA